MSAEFYATLALIFFFCFVASALVHTYRMRKLADRIEGTATSIRYLRQELNSTQAELNCANANLERTKQRTAKQLAMPPYPTVEPGPHPEQRFKMRILVGAAVVANVDGKIDEARNRLRDARQIAMDYDLWNFYDKLTEQPSVREATDAEEKKCT